MSVCSCHITSPCNYCMKNYDCSECGEAQNAEEVTPYSKNDQDHDMWTCEQCVNEMENADEYIEIDS